MTASYSRLSRRLLSQGLPFVQSLHHEKTAASPFLPQLEALLPLPWEETIRDASTQNIYSIPPARATCVPISAVHAVPDIPSCRTWFSQCQFLCCCLSSPQPPSTPQPTHPRTHTQTCCTTASPPSAPTPPPRTRLRRSTSPRSCPDPNLSGNHSPVQARRRTTVCPAPRASLQTRS